MAVTFRPAGRLGNFLFMAANCLSYAKRYDLEFHIPAETTDDFWSPIYFPHLRNYNFNPSLPNTVITEKTHAYHDLPFYETWRGINIYMSGYFQSPTYFDWCRDYILDSFKLKWELSADSVISLHIRRGDYLLLGDKHPVMTESYLLEGMKIFNEKGYNNFYVFSDDIPYCETKFITENYPGQEFIFSKGRNEIEDLEVASGCHGHLNSASTFSFWLSWLNRKEDKVIVVPDESSWFGPGYNDLDLSTLIPPGWIKLKY